jgi:hypothetical protein
MYESLLTIQKVNNFIQKIKIMNRKIKFNVGDLVYYSPFGRYGIVIQNDTCNLDKPLFVRFDVSQREIITRDFTSDGRLNFDDEVALVHFDKKLLNFNSESKDEPHNPNNSSESNSTICCKDKNPKAVYFKAGDVVFDYSYGKGIVVDVNDFFLHVKFESANYIVSYFFEKMYDVEKLYLLS